jgi:E3 ubiquitin-protein ligase HUWE1
LKKFFLTEGSSDEEDEDEEEASTSSQNAQNDAQVQQENSERTPIALIDYILNTMKFIDAILSNNSTDDHCREFVQQGGLRPLLKILGLPNLPVNCPVTNPAQAVATVCKSILNLAHETNLFKEGLAQLSEVLEVLKPMYTKLDVPSGPKLLLELAGASNVENAFNNASVTPLLHAMGAAHGYIIMLVHVCRTGQSEIRNLSLQNWGSEEGLRVIKGLADLYTSLVWESTLLLAYCSEEYIPSDFTREDIEKLNAFFDKVGAVGHTYGTNVIHRMFQCESSNTGSDSTVNVASAMEALTTNPPTISMDVDQEAVTLNLSTSLKYIKPLLGASSRLGRALAELFGLLVKLCVGSPIRQRRGQNIIAAPPLPTPYARSVATALNVLLADGLDYEKLPACPLLKSRITFLICSVGFTSPMLFDEKRYPYHLMLKKFVELGGQATFFNTFRWALTAGGTISIEKAFEQGALPEGRRWYFLFLLNFNQT